MQIELSNFDHSEQAILTIRNIDPAVGEALRQRAAQNGHSIEGELHAILDRALGVQRSSTSGIGTRIHQRFASLGGVDTLESPDQPLRDPQNFG